MKRTVLKVICIASGVLFTTLAIFLAISAMQVFSRVNAASVGIIGGADGPTAIFLTGKMMRIPYVCTIIAAFLTFSGTGLVLLFTRKPKN
jgi:Na+-transporting methylmalonyl-CoA/oxaloacetate decarboxylase beta subunit